MFVSGPGIHLSLLMLFHKAWAHWNPWASWMFNVFGAGGKSPKQSKDCGLLTFWWAVPAFQRNMGFSESMIVSKHAMQLWLSGFSWYVGISSFLDLLWGFFSKAFHFSFGYIPHCSVPLEKDHCRFKSLCKTFVPFTNLKGIGCLRKATVLYWRCPPAAVKNAKGLIRDHSFSKQNANKTGILFFKSYRLYMH